MSFTASKGTVTTYFPNNIEELLFPKNAVGETLTSPSVYETNITEADSKAIKTQYFLGGGKIDTVAIAREAAYSVGGADWDSFYQSRLKPKIEAAVTYYVSNYLSSTGDREEFIKQATIQYFTNGNDGKIASKLKYNLFKGPAKFARGYLQNNGQYYSNFGYLDQASPSSMETQYTTYVFDLVNDNSTPSNMSKNDMAIAFGALGLDEHINKTLPAQLSSRITAAVANNDPLLVQLEDATKISDAEFSQALAAITGRSSEVTRRVERRLRQCALFLHAINNWSSWGADVIGEQTSKAEVYSGRILPVAQERIDSEQFINIARISKVAKGIFDIRNKTKVKPKVAVFQELDFELAWIYSDGANLQKMPIQIIQNTSIKNIDDLKTKYKSIPAKIKEISDLENLRSGFSTTYTFKDLKVTLEGQDPALSRRDAKVSLSFTLNSMNALLTPIGIADVNGNIVPVLMKDLITLPNTSTVEVKTVNGSTTSKKEYHPDYSRVKLSLYRNLDEESELIYDLCMVSHSINRNSESGETTLTIEYVPYFEQMMHQPEMDCLATPTIIDNREQRKKDLSNVIASDNCSDDLVRETERANREISRIELADALNKGFFLDRIYTSKILREYKFKTGKVNTNNELGSQSIANTLNPRTDYIDTIDSPPTQTTTASKLITQGGGTVQTANTPEATQQALEDTLEGAFVSNYCFTFGDLMEMLTDCIYDTTETTSNGVRSYTRTSAHNSFSSFMNMKFLISTIKVPDPKNIGASIDINPIIIPIDLGYFIEWFNENYTKKGISSISIGAFLRDLLERLLNDVLYDTCYSFLMPEENPPLLVVSYASDSSTNKYDNTTSKGFFKVINNTSASKPVPNGWFDPLNPFDDTTMSRNCLMLSDHNTDASLVKNYCCIHQSSDASFLGSKSSTIMKNTAHCITFYHGIGFNNYLQNVSFSKTDVPHLREMRMHHSNFGNFSLLANVYDLTFTFENEMANTYIYPGVLINFILTDFAGKTGFNFAAGDEVNTESDPHTSETTAEILGFGGYYRVTKVEYTRGSDNKAWTITVTAKFNYTDANSSMNRKSLTERLMSQPQNCIDVYNAAAVRVVSISSETGISGDRFNIITPPT